jgi:DinB superfamily
MQEICIKLTIMKKTNSQKLIAVLEEDVRKIILQTSRLKNEPAEKLLYQPAPGKWSIVKVLEHLNIYSRHYINAVEKKLHHHETESSQFFYPGLLGNYFTGLMKPGINNSIYKKMKAPKNAIPSENPDVTATIEEFNSHQYHLLKLLQIAASANLNSIKIPTSLSSLLKLKLGDTFRFFIAHEQRHFIQIENINTERVKQQETLAA